MTTHEKALEVGLEAYNKFECGSDVDHVRSIVAGYLSALLPEYTAGLVERLIHAEPGRTQVVRNEAASLIQSQVVRIAELEAGLVDVTASLVAAHSLLSRSSKKAAASDKMFDQMLADYRASIDRARAILNKRAEG